MTHQKEISLLTALFLFFVLSGCSTDDAITKSSDGTDQQDINIDLTKESKIVVDQTRCIGCGKCARIAPDNFAIERDLRKAVVISQDVTSQNSVDQAVQICPTDAISQ